MSGPPLQLVCVDASRKHLVLTITETRLDNDIMARRLEEELLAAIETVGPGHVVLDLHKVAILHSIALQSLLNLRRRVDRRSGHVVLCGLCPIVEQVFQITGLIAEPNRPAPVLFEVKPDVAAALAHLELLPPPPAP